MNLFKKLFITTVLAFSSLAVIAAPPVVVVKTQPAKREVVIVEEPVREVRYVERSDNFYPPRTWLGVVVDVICTPFVWVGEWLLGCDGHPHEHRR